MFRKIIKGLKDVWCGTLEFDTEPKKGSFNPVTSDGVYEAINGPAGAKEIVYFDVDPSDPPSGIYDDITVALSNDKEPVIKIDGAVYFYNATGTDEYIFVGGYGTEVVNYTTVTVSDDDSVVMETVDTIEGMVFPLYYHSTGEAFTVADKTGHALTKTEIVNAYRAGQIFMFSSYPASNTQAHWGYCCDIRITSENTGYAEFLILDAFGGDVYSWEKYVIRLLSNTESVTLEGPNTSYTTGGSGRFADGETTVSVSTSQSFNTDQKAQGRNNIGAASASDVTALQSQVSSLSDVSAYSVKGEATVAQLNAGPSGIQAGWAYQLTDSGTLTDGSLAVVAGDTVAWDGTKWFPLVKSDYYATKDALTALQIKTTNISANVDENASKIESLDGIKFVSGFWAVDSATTTAPTTRTANDYISSVKCLLKKDDVALITAVCSAAALPWSFYDLSGTVVTLSSNSNYYKYEFKATSDGILLVNATNSKPHDISFASYTRDLAEHNDVVSRSLMQDGAVWEKGLFGITSSTSSMPSTYTANNDWRFAKIKVKAGERYEWRGTGSGVSIPYMLFDVNGNTLSYGASTTANYTYVINVVQDGWLICNSSNLAKHYLKRVPVTEDYGEKILNDRVVSLYNDFEWAGGFWNVSSSTTTQPTTRTANASFKSSLVYLKKGEKCVVTAVGTAVALPWSFYDVNKNIVAYAVSLRYYKYEYVAPSDGILLVNGVANEFYDVYIESYTRGLAEQNEIAVKSMLSKSLAWNVGLLGMTSSVQTVPYYTTDDSDWRFIKIPVKAGDRYKYSGTGSVGALPYAIFDAAGDLIYVETSTAHVSAVIDVIQDGWLVCNSTEAAPHSLVRVTTVEDVPTNNENPTANPMMAFSNIVCIGDSLTDSQVWTGESSVRQAYKTYPQNLGKICDASVEAFAVSGDTAIASWTRYKDSVTSKSNALAILYLGTNAGLTDTLSTDAPEEDQYTEWADTNTGCYAKWVAKLQDLGYKVLLIKPYASSGNLSVTQDVIEQVADRFGCAVVGPVYSNEAKYHLYPDLSGSNGVHFNDLGYAWFASVLVNKVSALDSDNLKYIIPE